MILNYQEFISLRPLTKEASDNSSGCSAVRLAYLLWEQGVVGSNPTTPTTVSLVALATGLFHFQARLA